MPTIGRSNVSVITYEIEDNNFSCIGRVCLEYVLLPAENMTCPVCLGPGFAFRPVLTGVEEVVDAENVNYDRYYPLRLGTVPSVQSSESHITGDRPITKDSKKFEHWAKLVHAAIEKLEDDEDLPQLICDSCDLIDDKSVALIPGEKNHSSVALFDPNNIIY